MEPNELRERLALMPRHEQPAFIAGFRHGFATGLELVVTVQIDTEETLRAVNAARRLLRELEQ